MKTLLEQLIAEKELLSDPARWTKGTFARDINNIGVNSDAKSAVCWCQFGAGVKISNKISDMSRLESQWVKESVSSMYISRELIVDSIEFNDQPSTTHADLMEFYDICIIHAKNCE